MPERTLAEVIAGYSFLEGPRWYEGRLWLSDFYTHQVIAVSEDGDVERIATVPNQPSGLGWLPDGRLLVVSMKDRRVLRREHSGELVEHADLTAVAGGYTNDMVVDAVGRAYVGNFGFDLMGGGAFRAACLAMVEPDGTVTVAAEGLKCPNGSVITPDGRTLIVNETVGNRVSSFDIDADGTLGPRRDWANFGALPDSDSIRDLIAAAAIGPDGSTLDAQGALWIADAINHRAVRVAEGGAILDEIDSGEERVFAVALGGADGQTLYLCVAPEYFESDRASTRLGRLLSTKVDVPLAPRP